jgi:hypothetical protein
VSFRNTPIPLNDDEGEEMSIPKIIHTFCLVGAASMLFAETIPEGYKLEEEFKSDTGDTIVKAYRGKPYDWSGSLEFRVYRTDSPTVNGSLLWKGENRASALISYDGENIAINNHVMSDLGLLYVFTRQNDGTYIKCDFDFMKKTSEIVKEELSKMVNGKVVFDHSYVYGNTWLSDHQLLVGFSASNSGNYNISSYWFIFNTDSKALNFNLNKVNQCSIHFNDAKTDTNPPKR